MIENKHSNIEEQQIGDVKNQLVNRERGKLIERYQFIDGQKIIPEVEEIRLRINCCELNDPKACDNLAFRISVKMKSVDFPKAEMKKDLDIVTDYGDADSALNLACAVRDEMFSKNKKLNEKEEWGKLKNKALDFIFEKGDSRAALALSMALEHGEIPEEKMDDFWKFEQEKVDRNVLRSFFSEIIEDKLIDPKAKDEDEIKNKKLDKAWNIIQRNIGKMLEIDLDDTHGVQLSPENIRKIRNLKEEIIKIKNRQKKEKLEEEKLEEKNEKRNYDQSFVLIEE